jgi:hypothetical protein
MKKMFEHHHGPQPATTTTTITQQLIISLKIMLCTHTHTTRRIVVVSINCHYCNFVCKKCCKVVVGNTVVVLSWLQLLMYRCCCTCNCLSNIHPTFIPCYSARIIHKRIMMIIIITIIIIIIIISFIQ